jgi:hypothetical protein
MHGTALLIESALEGESNDDVEWIVESVAVEFRTNI